MREQSHLDAMREAIRGDLERARSRNPSIFENAVPAQASAAEPKPVVQTVPEPEPVLPSVPEPEPEPLPEVDVEPEPEPAPKASFLGRLAFWRR